MDTLDRLPTTTLQQNNLDSNLPNTFCSVHPVKLSLTNNLQEPVRQLIKQGEAKKYGHILITVIVYDLVFNFTACYEQPPKGVHFPAKMF